MSYARVIEGDTNDQVLDPAFHRKVQPPSVSESMKRAGVPQPPVSSINRPQIFSFPRPASSYAASDLKGQQSYAVGLDKTTRSRARIIGKQKQARTVHEKRILSTAARAIRHRQAGLHGLGQDQPLLDTTVAPIQMVTVSDPSVIAAKVPGGVPLTSQEVMLWNALTPAARGAFTLLPGVSAFLQTPAGKAEPTAGVPAVTAAGVSPTFGAQLQAILNQQTIPGLPNTYLLAAVAGLALVLGLKKKR